MTDLAREIEDMLCDCDMRADDHGSHWASCAWRVRGRFILAYVQRKLNEAKADSELLANVEKRIKLSLLVEKVPRAFRVSGFRMGFTEAPTLVEALRKLVESDS